MASDVIRSWWNSCWKDSFWCYCYNIAKRWRKISLRKCKWEWSAFNLRVRNNYLLHLLIVYFHMHILCILSITIGFSSDSYYTFNIYWHSFFHSLTQLFMGCETYARFFTLREERKVYMKIDLSLVTDPELDSWLKEAIIYWRESNLSFKNGYSYCFIEKNEHLIKSQEKWILFCH